MRQSGALLQWRGEGEGGSEGREGRGRGEEVGGGFEEWEWVGVNEGMARWGRESEGEYCEGEGGRASKREEVEEDVEGGGEDEEGRRGVYRTICFCSSCFNPAP